MGHDRVRVGDIEVAVVCEGAAPVDLVEELPETGVDWGAERAEHAWAFHDATSWAWHVHAFALRTPEGVVMVDAGLGAFPPYRPWATSTDRHEALAAAGVDRDEVVAVALTHLHADHAGGTVLDGEPAFPNARHHVHPEDWSFAGAADQSGTTAAARRAMAVLDDRGLLELRADDHEVVGGVKVIWAPGHTPGHRTVLVTSDGETALFVGDALHTTPQVRLPEAPSNHDVDPEAACASRGRALHDAREHGWLVAVSHLARPFGRVAAAGWRSWS